MRSHRRCHSLAVLLAAASKSGISARNLQSSSAAVADPHINLKIHGNAAHLARSFGTVEIFPGWNAGISKHGITIFSAHQMGTARMGASPKNSVVDARGHCWHVAGLYVADASLFPTSTGAPLSLIHIRTFFPCKRCRMACMILLVRHCVGTVRAGKCILFPWTRCTQAESSGLHSSAQILLVQQVG